MVFEFRSAGLVQALSTSRMNKLYFLTSRMSATLHSRLAKHSPINGDPTRCAGSGVNSNFSNFATWRPEQLPILTTLGASSTAGIAITHSLVALNAVKL